MNVDIATTAVCVSHQFLLPMWNSGAIDRDEASALIEMLNEQDSKFIDNIRGAQEQILGDGNRKIIRNNYWYAGHLFVCLFDCYCK